MIMRSIRLACTDHPVGESNLFSKVAVYIRITYLGVVRLGSLGGKALPPVPETQGKVDLYTSKERSRKQQHFAVSGISTLSPDRSHLPRQSPVP
jgi:hypothetical protein